MHYFFEKWEIIKGENEEEGDVDLGLWVERGSTRLGVFGWWWLRRFWFVWLREDSVLLWLYLGGGGCTDLG